VTIAVVDTDGDVLGISDRTDAPVFRLDVSVQKARTSNFFARSDAGTKLTRSRLRFLRRKGEQRRPLISMAASPSAIVRSVLCTGRYSRTELTTLRPDRSARSSRMEPVQSTDCSSTCQQRGSVSADDVQVGCVSESAPSSPPVSVHVRSPRSERAADICRRDADLLAAVCSSERSA
jgi:hypothetical protein